jgi:hypothetical protein
VEVKQFYGAMEHTFDSTPFEADLEMGFENNVNNLAQIGDFRFAVKKPDNYEVKCEVGYTTSF